MTIQQKVRLMIMLLVGLMMSFDVMAEESSNKLSMPTLFADHMLLQRDIPCHIWGWGRPGTAVSVAFNGQNQQTTVAADGNWSLKLDAMDALSTGSELVVKDDRSELSFSNVVVGDIWICSGQSNMGVGVDRLKGVAPELWEDIVETTDYPNVRYMNVKEVKSPFEENRDISVQVDWTALTKDVDLSRLRPSGIGFIFATRLHRELDIPVAFIQSAIGSSAIETWTSREALMSSEEGKLIIDTWAKVQNNYSDERLKEYVDAEIREAQARGDDKQASKMKDPRHWPKEPIASRLHPCSAFNGMIAPLTKMSIKGVIWDQGEANTNRAWQYRELLPLMISDWRKHWEQGNGSAAKTLPFYQVQIQDWRQPLDRSQRPPSSGDACAEIRDAQRYAAEITENCEIVCTIDHREGGDTHPLLKNIPGERLAAVALARTYGKQIQWRGPSFKSAEVKDGQIQITFDGLGKGLMVGERSGHMVQGTAVDQALDYFAIAGADMKYVWAHARIDGDQVLVWNDAIKDPRYVRYAWEANPKGCNLYNKDGWPATPFRTDELPYKTRDKNKPLEESDWYSQH